MLQIHSRIIAEQSYQTAGQPHVRLNCSFFLSICATSRLPLDHWCKITTNESHFLPPPQPLIFHHLSLGYSHPGNDDQCLVAAAQHQYVLNTFFTASFFHFQVADIFFTISCTSVTMTMRHHCFTITTPLKPMPSTRISKNSCLSPKERCRKGACITHTTGMRELCQRVFLPPHARDSPIFIPGCERSPKVLCSPRNR